MTNKPWFFVLPLVLVGCASQSPAIKTADTAVAATSNITQKLSGDDTGALWATASADQKLIFCRASMRSYKASGTSSFSISAKTNSLTPETLCTAMDEYFSKKGTGLVTDRLGHAAGMAIIFAGKPYRPNEP